MQENIPRSLAEVYIPERFQHTRTDPPREFILKDTGADDPERIIILGSAIELNRLSRCSTWLADGTFRTSPEIFFQVYTLHGLYRNKVIPLLVALLPNKRQRTYERFLDAIFEAIDNIQQADPRQAVARARPATIII